MAKCPFAVWLPVTGSSGPHLSGPFKIVHHTTEGHSAGDAFDAFRTNRSDPHFTVDGTTIYQHIDTALGARALRNEGGGVQTNRDSAIQIELVAFAHLPKTLGELTNLARLCRWIEATHQVPRTWPAGLPRPARNGRDPGGHNRNSAIWDSQSGHYGHCHVPENTHWDPGFTTDEVNFLMAANFDTEGRLISEHRKTARALKRGTPKKAPMRSKAKSTMPDHSVVPIGLSAYLNDLALSPPSLPQVGKRALKTTRRRATAPSKGESAVVDLGSVLSFVAGVGAQEQEDVLYSVQLAQRAASGAFDRFTQTQSWYQKYVEVLQNVGWASEQLLFSRLDQYEGELQMDQAALAIIAAVATQNQLAVLKASVDALDRLANGDKTIELFEFHSSLQGRGNFQLGSVQKSNSGALTMAIGGFYFHSLDQRRRFLFFKWGQNKVHFWTAAQRLTLNPDFYAQHRAAVKAKLSVDAELYLSSLVLK